ncbi:hypothetical protein [Sulfuricurvum sp.]|uniref:hypothetical protein n=1 Tax=Sulfuricurvum sp. TaxID=2025608 RepID=UPI0035640D87
MADSIYGGRWGIDLDKEQANWKNVYGDMQASATGARSAQLKAIQASLRRRGFSDSGIGSAEIGSFAEGLQRADLGMAADIANSLQGIRENEYSRRYGDHQFELQGNLANEQARKQKNAGWGQLVGGIAGMAMGGNPYAALMGGAAQQPAAAPSQYYEGAGSQSNLLNTFGSGWADMASRYSKPKRPQTSGNFYYNRNTNQMR